MSGLYVYQTMEKEAIKHLLASLKAFIGNTVGVSCSRVFVYPFGTVFVFQLHELAKLTVSYLYLQISILYAVKNKITY